MLRPHRTVWIGLMVAFATFGIDQLNKSWMIHVFDIASRQPVDVAPALRLVMMWNRGISYGWFSGTGWGVRLALIAVSLVIVAWLAGWLWRTGSVCVAVALGLLIGGALGNALDRVIYGAVADFYLLHWGAYEWYVFNLADVAVVAGVVLLVYDGVMASGKRR